MLFRSASTVVIPVGYRSRFGHPAPDVLERLAGMRVLRTDLDGAVTVRLAEPSLQVQAERAVRPRYWRTAAGGADNLPKTDDARER